MHDLEQHEKTQEETSETQGFDETDFESALEHYLSNDFGNVEEGSLINGRIVKIGPEKILVDVNFKSEIGRAHV